METIEVALVHTKDTKGTRVWSATEEDAPITSLYIKRPTANLLPDNIVVTVDEA